MTGVAPDACVAGQEDNPFGVCECVGQVYLGPDCNQAFVCGDPAADPAAEGCLYECPAAGLSLVPDFGDIGDPVTFTCFDELVR